MLTATRSGFREIGGDDGVTRFAVDDGAPGTLVDVRELRTGPGGDRRCRHGASRGVSRALTTTRSSVSRTQVTAAGLQITEQIDRTYFRSMYFREPGQVLFELATDAPGFTVDEPLDGLGRALQLPAQHEHLREALGGRLHPLHHPGFEAHASMTTIERPDFVHVHVPPPAGSVDGRTLLLLHGTGGTERDLLEVGAAVCTRRTVARCARAGARVGDAALLPSAGRRGVR